MLTPSGVADDDRLAAITRTIRTALSKSHQEITEESLERRVLTISADLILLARCARTGCLITYADAITLRGHGIARNGGWLDDAYAYAAAPLGFPDLTMLVVNKATGQPSLRAFEGGRTILSKIPIDDVPAEQHRCVSFSGYEDLLGALEPIPSAHQLVQLLSSQSAKEREISRAVSNAICRVTQFGVEQKAIGKEYPHSLSRYELVVIAGRLWDRQNGRCALTGQAFEERSDEEGGVRDDRVSLDRIDNLRGYTDANVQLVTQFANRARGTLSVEEARRRLVQFGS